MSRGDACWSLKPEEAWAGFEGPGAGLKPARLMLIPISAMLAIGGSNTIKCPAPAQEVLPYGRELAEKRGRRELWAGIRIMGCEGLSVAEFLPHNSAINSRFQSENWPIFENHAIKGPVHSGILRIHGGSSATESPAAAFWAVFSAYAEVVPSAAHSCHGMGGILRVRGGSSTPPRANAI